MTQRLTFALLWMVTCGLGACAKGATGFDDTGDGARGAWGGTGGGAAHAGSGGVAAHAGTGGSGASGAQGGAAGIGGEAGTGGSGGTCVGGGTCPVSAMQLEVVNLGSPKHTVIRNTSTTCSMTLCDVGILHNDGAGDPSTVLPNQQLDPGQSIVVSESPGAGELSAGGTIAYTAGNGGAVYLCDGACSLSYGANVVDAMLFDTPPVAPPNPVVFNPAPLARVAAADVLDMEYVRTGSTGSPPTFVASDWETQFIPPTLFYDSFEDQDYSDWIANGSYTATIESIAGSHGDYAFSLNGQSSHYGGYRRVIPTQQPSEIEVRVGVADVNTASGYVVMGTDPIGSLCTNCFTMLLFRNGGLDYSMDTSGTLVAGATNNTLYRVEFRSINWSSKTTDIYVDGTLRASSVGFRDLSTSSISVIHFYNFYSAKAWWDEVRLIQ